jgi:hypothetical protein
LESAVRFVTGSGGMKLRYVAHVSIVHSGIIAVEIRHVLEDYKYNSLFKS